MNKNRNEKIDKLRGFCAIIVVVGHVFQRFSNYSDNILFNIIFSFQMPLFMFLSGFVVNYSKEIISGEMLFKHIKKRLLALLIPWGAWSILAYLLLSDTELFEYIRYASTHMESAFWFLFSLFTIDIIFNISSWLINSIIPQKGAITRFSFKVLMMAMLMIPLAIIGKHFGITFMAIKYSLYYSCFYILGYFIGIIYNNGIWEKASKYRDYNFVVMTIMYAVLISRFYIMTMPDVSIFIVIRLFISILACIIIIEVADRIIIKSQFLNELLLFCGTSSLEMYVVHYFVVRIIDGSMINLSTINGLLLSIFSCVIVLIITFVIIICLRTNKIANLLLFGKKVENNHK